MKRLILAAMAVLFAYPALAFPPCYNTSTTRVVDSGCTQNVKSGGTFTADSGSTVTLSGTTTIGGTLNTSSVTMSTSLTGNPLMQFTRKDLTVSTDIASTALTTILASVAGKTIYPDLGGISIMVSGSAASATSLALECGDGTLIASWPIADLTDLKPIGVGLYLSTQSTITTGAGGMGCAASSGIYLSNVGTKITTTTHVYVSVPYIVQ